MPLSLTPNEPSSPPLGRGFVRLRLDLAYDGTNFAGWAIQANGLRTVQDEVQKAIALVWRLREPVSVFVAGRTDAGVHARGQVVHFDIPEDSYIDFFKQQYSLNGLLPADIRINRVSYAPAGFDARFSALSRRYTYAIADGVADPITRNHVVNYWRSLDVDAMNEASVKLLGLHDFTTFCKPTDFGTAIRTLTEFSWQRMHYGVMATLEADAFCHSMVRSLVGALVPVGDGRRDVDFPVRMLELRTRTSEFTVMPAHGLILDEILYPADDQLQARQDLTRAKRDQI